MEADDFRQWTATYYAGTVTSLHLWDISEADVSHFTLENIEEDAYCTKQVSGMRKGGKTAFVTPKDLDFGIGRMCETLSEIIVGNIEYQTFRTLADAKKWLGVHDRPD